MVSTPNFGSQVPEFKSCWKNSAHDCMALHYTEPFIIILPLSQYDLSNLERDVKHQMMIELLLFKYSSHMTSFPVNSFCSFHLSN